MVLIAEEFREKSAHRVPKGKSRVELTALFGSQGGKSDTSGGSASMFAGKVAQGQTKSAEKSNSELANRRAHRSQVLFGLSAREQIQMLPRTIGNHAGLRLLAREAENRVLNRPPDQPVRRGLSWDFTRIPVFAPGRADRPEQASPLAATPLPGVIESKLEIGAANDPMEAEADRVAEQVVHMRDPSADIMTTGSQVLQRKRTESDEEGEQERRKRTHKELRIATALDETAAPPIVDEVLRSTGEPLEPATRAFMESKFRHNFSEVAIHSDAIAAESAESVDARAYTVGRHIVLGGGQPPLRSVEGQSLLAHELTHVVQQSRGGPAPQLSALAPHEDDARSAANAIAAGASFVNVACNTGVGLARDDKGHKPEAPPDPAVVREARLTKLARDPRDAHDAWKNLRPEEKTELVDKMIARYGAMFAHQFRDIAEHGKAQFGVTTWQPNTGPTPEQLNARGWRLLEPEVRGNVAFEVEVWVNAAGSTIFRGVSTYQFGQGPGGTTKKPPTEPPVEPPPCPESGFSEDFAKIIKEGWPAMEAFEASVERLATNPPGADATQTEAEIARTRPVARDFITKLGALQHDADEIGDEEECIANVASEEWVEATDEYTRLSQRYNTLKQPQAGAANPNP